jgi:hypothetical protein
MKSRNIDSSQVARSQPISTKNEGELLTTEKKQPEKEEEEARRGIDRSATAQALTGGSMRRIPNSHDVEEAHQAPQPPRLSAAAAVSYDEQARHSIGMR